jgi:hypothetical protein
MGFRWDEGDRAGVMTIKASETDRNQGVQPTSSEVLREYKTKVPSADKFSDALGVFSYKKLPRPTLYVLSATRWNKHSVADGHVYLY